MNNALDQIFIGQINGIPLVKSPDRNLQGSSHCSWLILAT